MNYTIRPPKKKGRVLLDRRKPFELFLRLGGPLFQFHFQIGSLTVTVGPGRPMRLNGWRKKP